MQNQFRKTGLIAIPLVVSLDQLSKHMIINALHLPDVITVTSFFDFLLTYNRGVSFGLFPADGILGKVILLSLACVLVLWLLFCLWKSPSKLESISYGLIIGGAVGNIIDRLYCGAVIDFLHFHYNNYSFPIFNIADSAITIGVGLILLQQAWHFVKNKQVT